MFRSVLFSLCVFMVTGCAPEHRVLQIEPDTYKITESGGWGYDLKDLKDEVKIQARIFAQSAGKSYVIISEGIEPEKTVGVYPAYDDTYTLVFKLVDSHP